MVHVLAMITAKPGQRDALLETFRANVPAVRAEEGCIEYGAAADVDVLGRFQAMLGADSFVVIEKWASADALKAHAAAPHMVAYAAKTKELIAVRAIHVLSPA
ncbi:MAG: antibiotic biosynthesis monooxygenase [Candidatus Eremiobacteraeota bacterium]|nr:antibiotic biosynthesis monooxygenase [Candidatus Eremiobacteraeota bacterium]